MENRLARGVQTQVDILETACRKPGKTATLTVGWPPIVLETITPAPASPWPSGNDHLLLLGGPGGLRASAHRPCRWQHESGKRQRFSHSGGIPVPTLHWLSPQLKRRCLHQQSCRSQKKMSLWPIDQAAGHRLPDFVLLLSIPDLPGNFAPLSSSRAIVSALVVTRSLCKIA